MTKKDYVVLAQIFKSTQPEDDFPYERRQWETMLAVTEALLQKDNKLFDSDKFEQACYNERI